MTEKIIADQSLLFVIDIQEKLAPVMWKHEEVVEAAAKLLKGAALLDIPHMVSEQYPKGIGHTVEDLKPLVDPSQVYEKISFSCLADPVIQDAMTRVNKKQIILCGIETHVCVLQTAIDLLHQKHDVFIVEEAVSSRTGKNKIMALDRLRQCGAHIVSLEMVLFEWLGKAGTDNFKKMLPLIK